MKKLLILVTVFMMMFIFVGCDTVDNEAAREEVLTMIKYFGDPVYEDTNFDDNFNDDVILYYGSCDLVMGFETNSVMLMMMDDDETITLEFYLDESNDGDNLVYGITLNYLNITDEVYIYLNYYNESLEDYVTEDLYEDWMIQLYYLSIYDIRWILTELNYLE